ncbi:MAG: glycosyl transferase family protein [Janthinobacterium lividum]
MIALHLVAAWHVATAELLAAVAVTLAVSTLDDWLVDIVFFVRSAWRSGIVYRRHARVAAVDLAAADPGWMAIIVPAWDEAAVIGAMLRDLTARTRYPRYRVFVGVYPNDPATLAEVAAVADPRVAAVACSRNGPTTKADCLNHLWRAVVAHEAAAAIRFKAVVLHDAEDVVDARELDVFDHLIGRLAMVQLPVVPLVDPGSRWVSGHYLDEFAEAHGKDIVVREAIGAAVPSAGVACAIERAMLGRLAGPTGRPFDPACMTEDYELGLRIAALGGRGALVRIPAAPGGRMVATREHFPATLEAAIRQKSRWLLGIALSGWDRIGWSGGWADRYMLVRDRKTIVAPLLAMAGYVAFGMVAVDLAARLAVVPARGFDPLVRPGSPLAALLWLNSIALGWRLGLRAGFTAATHSWREGLRAIPRATVANWINAIAAIRALRRYHRILAGRETAVWDKTAHRFPGQGPAPDRR